MVYGTNPCILEDFANWCMWAGHVSVAGIEEREGDCEMGHNMIYGPTVQTVTITS